VAVDHAGVWRERIRNELFERIAERHPPSETYSGWSFCLFFLSFYFLTGSLLRFGSVGGDNRESRIEGVAHRCRRGVLRKRSTNEGTKDGLRSGPRLPRLGVRYKAGNVLRGESDLTGGLPSAIWTAPHVIQPAERVGEGRPQVVAVRPVKWDALPRAVA
jgi:hypothetical protein